MADIFKGFDFALLDGPDFGEDSVREEVIVPLLAALGYSSSPPHQIIRSRRLEHPFVYIGTVKKPVSIIPDYLLQRDGRNAWILDAKAPGETIDSGKHVEQAYSYAIHKDVRVSLYGLCNGRRLVVFDVTQWPAVLDVPVQDLPTMWPMVLDLLGTRAAWPEGRRPGFLPDFGLALKKAGLAIDETGKKIYQLFASVPVRGIARAEDNAYVLNGFVCYEQVAHHFLTLDFDRERYEQLLTVLPEAVAERIRSALVKQPYQIIFQPDEMPTVGFVADVGDDVFTNKNESYCPLLPDEFLPGWVDDGD